jgi:hypothetical protein
MIGHHPRRKSRARVKSECASVARNSRCPQRPVIDTDTALDLAVRCKTHLLHRSNTKVTYPENAGERKMEMPNSIGHHSSSCRRNSWMFSCWDAVRTSSHGRAALLAGTITRSVCSARPPINTTGRRCVAEIPSTTRQPRPPQADAVPARENPPGCRAPVALSSVFPFAIVERTSAHGMRVRF